MISILASVSFAAVLCQASPVEKAFSSEKLKELPYLYRQNATLMKCKKIFPERAIVSNPVRKGNMCVFSELDLELNSELTAVASLGNDGTCPAISFVDRRYPGSEWIFTLGEISQQDALQIKNLVSKHGIAMLDDESERRKGKIRNTYYGTHSLTAFSVRMADMDDCRDRVSSIRKMTYTACAKAHVHNDTITGWGMYFAKRLDGVYVFVASARVVY